MDTNGSSTPAQKQNIHSYCAKDWLQFCQSFSNFLQWHQQELHRSQQHNDKHKSCRPLFQSTGVFKQFLVTWNHQVNINSWSISHPQGKQPGSIWKSWQACGIYHNKQEFLNKAFRCKHPCNSFGAVTSTTRMVVKQLLTEDFSAMAKKRIGQISRLSQMKKELALEERVSKPPFPSIVQKSSTTKRCYYGRNCWRKQTSRTRVSWISCVARRLWGVIPKTISLVKNGQDIRGVA